MIDGWLVARGEQVLEQSRTNLVGPHNAENMLAALAVADLHQIPREAAMRAMSAYKPLPHRLEKVAEIGGVTFLNDSKATNIDALEKALQAMRAPAVLLAGGKDKGLDFDRSADRSLREKVKAIVLIGQMTEKLYAAWNAAAPCYRAATLAEAVDEAQALAEVGATSSSFRRAARAFDMFPRILKTAAISSARVVRAKKNFDDDNHHTQRKRETMDNNDSTIKPPQTGGV